MALLERIITAYQLREDEMAAVITDERGASRRFSVAEQVPSGLGHFEAARDVLASYECETAPDGGSTIVHKPIGSAP